MELNEHWKLKSTTKYNQLIRHSSLYSFLCILKGTKKNNHKMVELYLRSATLRWGMDFISYTKSHSIAITGWVLTHERLCNYIRIQGERWLINVCIRYETHNWALSVVLSSLFILRWETETLKGKMCWKSNSWN